MADDSSSGLATNVVGSEIEATNGRHGDGLWVGDAVRFFIDVKRAGGPKCEDP